MDKLKCYPVMLPTPNQSAPIVQYTDKTVQNRIFAGGSSEHKGQGWNYQHLYLVSDEAIKDGDKFLFFGENGIQMFTMQSHVGYGIKTNTSNAEGNHTVVSQSKSKKLIATTDPSLGLPLIPDSFIQEWVASQGKIESLYVSMKNEEPTKVGRGGEREVIILPTKSSFTREKVKEIAGGWSAHLSNIIREKGRIDPYKEAELFDEWFDNNY